MKSLELKWGLIIGGAYLVWLYLSYFLGMHTSGILWIQVMSLISILITLVGFVFGLRAVQRAAPETTWLEGVKSGIIMAGITAAIAVLTQVGYFTVIHPEFPVYMTEETKYVLTTPEMTEEEAREYFEGVRKTFSMKSYMLQAGGGMFFFGVVFSTIIMAFLRRLAK